MKYIDWILPLNFKNKFKLLFEGRNPETVVFESEKINDWIGPFKDWGSASLDCLGYDSENILEKCKDSLLQVKNGDFAYERDSVLFSEIDYNWELLTSLLLSKEGGSITVLDFGGALGSTYYQHKAFFKRNGLQISWSIIEQENFVHCGNDNFKNNELRFHLTIKESVKDIKPNILILSSVLSYLEHPYEMLNKLIDEEIPYLFIDKTLMYDSDNDFLMKQIVPEYIYKAELPCWILGASNFKNVISEKYEMVFEFSPFKGAVKKIDNEKVKYYGALYKLKV